jgi:bacterioferritin-associated ferredoxin
MIRFQTITQAAAPAAASAPSATCTTVAEVAASASFAAPENAAARILCHCLQVTEAMVDEAIRAGVVQSLRDVIICTGAGDGCTACRAALRAYLMRRGVAG